MKRNILLMAGAALLLSGCATVSTTSTDVTTFPKAKPSAQPSTPAAAAVDLTSTQQFCDQLKQQFVTQLPSPVLNGLKFSTVAGVNPLTQQGNAALCQIGWQTNGDTVLRNGLTPDFMRATLDRLGWQTPPQLQMYSADSPVAHRLAMTNGQYIAAINYSFAPPAGKCSSDQPIAACKFPRKQWLYRLQTQIFAADQPIPLVAQDY